MIEVRICVFQIGFYCNIFFLKFQTRGGHYSELIFRIYVRSLNLPPKLYPVDRDVETSILIPDGYSETAKSLNMPAKTTELLSKY